MTVFFFVLYHKQKGTYYECNIFKIDNKFNVAYYDFCITKKYLSIFL